MSVDTTPEQFERTPPQDVHAEQAVLGAMLLSTNAAGDIAEILRPDDFYRPQHAAIYRVVLDLYTRGEPADSVTVAAALANNDDLARVGGAGYLHTLMATVPTAANGTYYARIVADHAQDRRLIEVGTRIVQLGYQAARDPDNPKHNQATKYLYDAITDNTADPLVPIADDIRATLDAIEAGPQRGLSTGFTDLDVLLGGLFPDQLIYVGARPGVGKSTLVMDIARSVGIRQNLPVLYFSLEMSRQELITRILSAEARVPLHLLRAGSDRLDINDWTRLGKASGELTDAQIFIDDSPGLSFVDILARARRHASRTPLGLIVVDHVHIMGSVGGKANETREREVARTSSGLKLMAKDVHCPVVAAAQLNRGPENRMDKRPGLSDLRDSGSLEQDADVVILLHRDDYHDKESPRAGEADFIVAKHRNGPTDTVTVASQLHLSRFHDMAI